VPNLVKKQRTLKFEVLNTSCVEFKIL
jgi:hypothetical protein